MSVLKDLERHNFKYTKNSAIEVNHSGKFKVFLANFSALNYGYIGTLTSFPVTKLRCIVEAMPSEVLRFKTFPFKVVTSSFSGPRHLNPHNFTVFTEGIISLNIPYQEK